MWNLPSKTIKCGTPYLRDFVKFHNSTFIPPYNTIGNTVFSKCGISKVQAFLVKNAWGGGVSFNPDDIIGFPRHIIGSPRHFILFLKESQRNFDVWRQRPQDMSFVFHRCAQFGFRIADHASVWMQKISCVQVSQNMQNDDLFKYPKSCKTLALFKYPKTCKMMCCSSIPKHAK